MPIYFIFDSKSVFSRPDVRFTAGSLAANFTPDILSAAEDLEQMPFDLVYHDDKFHMSERSNIVFHRQAEVIVPQRLALGALRHIVCRSQAEQETFLHLLPQNARMRWRNRISIESDLMPVFFKHWAYVESANLSSSRLTFHFNESSETSGPFHAEAYINHTISPRKFSWQNASFTANKSLNLNLPSDISDYFVLLTLDGQLAFADRYQDNGLPW